MKSQFLIKAIEANREIYKTIQNGFSNNWQEEFEIGAGGDISCGIDLYAESVFVKYLNTLGQIESEESGIIGTGDKKIVIDPLDGSSNILSYFPYYGSSVALIDENGILEEAVVTNFANGDIFYKAKNRPLLVSKIDNINFKEEKVVNNPKVGLFERSYAYDKVVKKLFEKELKYRAPGAVALSLAYAHRVNFVLYIGKIRIYDIAAGLSFCEDLKVRISDKYVIVAHKENLVNTLEEIVKKEDLK